MDHYQVRGWTPWHRFITLAIPALAILTTLTTHDDHDTDAEHIAIIAAESRRLLNALIITPAHNLAHTMRWLHGDAKSKPAPDEPTTSADSPETHK